MNATATLPPEVADYLDRVRAALADVPADERDEMLADLEVSLLEGAEDSVEPPEARLGPPERFAQELRAAAGIEHTAAPAPTPRPSLRDRLRALAASPRGVAARRAANEMAGVWWVARGYVAVCALALFGDYGWSGNVPLIPFAGAADLGMGLLIVAIFGSVWLGLRSRYRGTGGTWLTTLNVVLAVAAAPVFVQVFDGRASQSPQETFYSGPAEDRALTHYGEQVRNIYPYSRDGKLLLDVMLYDDNGRALEIGSRDPKDDPLRRHLFTPDNRPVLHAFPIRYFEPGSSQVKRPRAVPQGIEIPKIQTPPLKVKRP